MKLHLKVVHGKPRGHCLGFPKGEYVFGRGPECHVRPNSELVSRQHCLLTVTEEGSRVRDLGSTNGTLINGKLVIDDCPLIDGDTLQLGTLVLQVFARADMGATISADTGVFSSNETQVHALDGII